MAQSSFRPRRSDNTSRALLALLCAALLAPGEGALLAQETPPAQAAPEAQEQVTKLPPDQLDSLVAPIALYPDPLLAQTLVASTYPLELVQLQQWLEKHKDLKDKALADAVAKEPWDPSIQSMAAVPEVVKRLSDDIQWTTQLGDAFLDQQSDVMDAVQRMRKKAQDKGALASNEQQKVETKVVEEKQVIVVEQSNPEVVYVPSYSPTVVYGPPVYPYPPVYYPPYYPGTALISFGVGMAMGAAIWGGSCCGCGWGGNNVNVNVNNNFNRNTNINRGQGGNNNWQHNSQHRGGAPYSNKATASKYGGSARGESPGSRGQGGAGSRGGGAGVSDRSAGGGGSRGGGGAGGGTGGAGGGFSGGGGGGADRVGSRDMSSGGGSRGGSSSFGGGSSGGYSGSSARSSSSRGSSSMSSSRGGGGGRSGGGGGRRR
jgi:uncharacterized protein DUF3300